MSHTSESFHMCMSHVTYVCSRLMASPSENDYADLLVRMFAPSSEREKESEHFEYLFSLHEL